MTIFGSWIPAREYSLSICVDGSIAEYFSLTSTSRRKHTHPLGLRQKPGPFQDCLHPFSARWAKPSPMLVHLLIVACARRFVVLAPRATWSRHIAVFLVFDGEATQRVI